MTSWLDRAATATYEAAIRAVAEIPTARLDRLCGYLSRRGRRGVALQCVDCGTLLTEQTIGDECVEGLLCAECADGRRDEDPAEPDPPEYEREEDR